MRERVAYYHGELDIRSPRTRGAHPVAIPLDAVQSEDGGRLGGGGDEDAARGAARPSPAERPR